MITGRDHVGELVDVSASFSLALNLDIKEDSQMSLPIAPKQFVAALVVLASSALSAPVRAIEGEADRFLREYPNAGRQLEARYAHLQGEGLYEQVSQTASNRPPFRARLSFAVEGMNRKIELRHERTGQVEMIPDDKVYCRNQQHDFKLNRKGDKGAYTVGDISGATESRGSNPALDHTYGRYLVAPFTVGSIKLTEMISDPSFVVASATTEKVGDDELVRINFTYGVGNAAQEGFVLLAPSKGWTIREWETRLDTLKVPIYSKITYRPTGDDLPLPRVIEIKDADFTLKTLSFDNVEFKPTPVEEFTLAHYGLPDVSTPGASGGPWNTAFWLAGAAAVAIFMGALLRRFGSRLSAAS